MHSPKFKFAKGDIEKLFLAKEVGRVWRKKIRQQIRRQIIFDPIEFKDIDGSISAVASIIERDICDAQYQPRPVKRYLVEKSRGLCRQMTMPHPIDLLVLEVLSESVSSELERSKPSKKAFFEPDKGDFMRKRVDIYSNYGAFASWKRFQKDGDSSGEVFRFLSGVAEQKSEAVKLISYLKTHNYSFAQRIFFPKVLIALAAKCNPHFIREFAVISKQHRSLTADPHFKRMGF
jgi:hypothetical protein